MAMFDYTSPDRLQTRRAIYDRDSTRKQTWNSWLLERVAAETNHPRIEDVGGGYGSVWQEWAPKGESLTLTDASLGMLADATAVSSRAAMRAEQLAIRNASADVVTAFNVLYHV